MKRRLFLHGVAGLVGTLFAPERWGNLDIRAATETRNSQDGLNFGVPDLNRLRSAWDPMLRIDVEDFQEQHYRSLADKLGLAGDPAKAYKRFSSPGMHADSLKEFIRVERLWREHGSNPQSPPELTLRSAEFQKKVAAIFDAYTALDTPTKYEDKSSYRIMSLSYDLVAKVLLDKNALPNPAPVLATLASGTVNARIREDRSNEPRPHRQIIYFEHGLFRFLYDFALLTAWSVPTFSLQELNDDMAIARMPGRYTMPFQASQSFVGTVLSYIADGNVANLPIPVPPHNLVLAIVLTGQMHRFMMAHELSHLTLGHLVTTQASKEEFDADAAAMALVSSKYVGGHSWAFNVWACDIAVTGLHLLDFALGIMEFGARPNWVSTTYPPWLSRRQRLRELAQGPEGNGSDVGRAALGALYRMNDAIFEKLANDFLTPVLFIARDIKKLRPSVMWRNRIDKVFSPSK